MDIVGWIILVVSGLYILAITFAEGLAVLTGRPTISERMRGLWKSAPIAVLLYVVVQIGLIVHFWGA